MGEVFLSHKPLEVYEAQGNLLARFALEEGEALEPASASAPLPFGPAPRGGKPSSGSPPRPGPGSWPTGATGRGHRVEKALGFLLSGKPHTWFLVDGLPLDPSSSRP